MLDIQAGQFVEVAVIPKPVVLVTDATGHFDIERVPPGPSQVEVTRIGYADLIQVLSWRSAPHTRSTAPSTGLPQ